MMNWQRKCRLAALGVLAVATIGSVHAALAQSASPQVGGDFHVVEGISEPSQKHRVTFESNASGTEVIKEVLVKPGDRVKAGQPLMVEDTDEARATLAVLKAAADATGAIQEAQVTINIKAKELHALQNAGEASVSQTEIFNAQLDLEVAQARKQEAVEEQSQRKLEYQRQLMQIQHMTLRSPIDGLVEQVNLFAGEAVDANSDQQGACYIISNDPMWVELHLPAQEAGRLKMSDSIQVAYPEAPNDWRQGQVIFLDPTVDYVGRTRTVRISVPNPDHFPSGLPMLVRLPDKVFAGAAGDVGMVQP
jgi:multidrug efflux pump subunit AcrA (membrane-fusion protein)